MTDTGLWRRWLVFNGVGLLGVGVQVGLVGLLVHGLHVHYLVATAIAVETAVLHNFIWHQHWTWRDRPSASTGAAAARLLRFHLLNGTVSLAGNLAIMAVLSGTLAMEPVAANAVAIAVCSTLNFLASEALVFKTTKITVMPDRVSLGVARIVSLGVSLGLSLGAPSTARADVETAELQAKTIAAWQQYERQVDDRYGRPAPAGTFFVHDAFKLGPGWRARVTGGQLSMVRVPSFAPGGAEPSVPDGVIHHWAGAVFIPGVTLDHVLRYLNDRAGRESEAFDDVVSSKLIARDGDRLRIYMKLRRESVIVVTYNTEHAVEYRRLGEARASSRSVATKIAEIDKAGTPQEREKPAGNDHGFLWRLNAYWRYEQMNGGVLIECESVSLSRDVPFGLGWLVNPKVEGIARESLQKTLVSLRTELSKSRPATAERRPIS
jgi:putative flippase GtrA